nr:hypothetical protein [Tanacetum cinerariifolium]
MLSPEPDSFYHTEQKMALGYQNPFYLKQAQKKQQSLYDGKVLLEKHDPPVVHDSEETLQLAQESLEKMKQLNKEIKTANYTKINHLSGVFVPQTAMSREDLYFTNISKRANVSKSISTPNDDFSDDTTPSVARKFLNEEADESLDKQKSLELEIERPLKASVSHDIMSIVQNSLVDVPSDLRTELDRTKEKLELCIIKKEKEYVVLWNNWYTKCEECKYDKISYDKAYNDMQQKVERLPAQLRDLKGKSSNTLSASNTLDPLNLKLESKIVELEFQVVNYDMVILNGLAKHKALELEIERLLKAVVSQDIMNIVQKESVVDTSDLQTELERTKERFENCIIKKENEYAKLWNDWYKKCDECKYDKISYDKAYKDMQQKIERLEARLGDLKGKSKDTSCVTDTRNPLSQKLENENDNKHDTNENTKFAKQPIVENLPNIGETHALSKPVTSNSVSTPQESKVVKNDTVIALGMFRINPDKTSREAKNKDVNSDLNGLSSTRVDNTKTRRPQPRSNTKHDRVPSASKSSRSKNKEAEVEEHHRNLLLSKNNKHMSSACNNIKLDSQDVISKVVCTMCKQCLISVNHDDCLRNYVNGKILVLRNKRQRFLSKKSKRNISQRWSPTGRLFDQEGKLVASSESESQYDCSNGDNACTSNPVEPTIKRFPNATFFLAGFGDLQWGNILITRVYFVEGLGHNLFSVGLVYTARTRRSRPKGNTRNARVLSASKSSEVKKNVTVEDHHRTLLLSKNQKTMSSECNNIKLAIRNDESKIVCGDRSTNLYTINLHEMASASSICLMARVSSTKSRLWHQRLSHLNFDTINDLAKNDLVSGLPKFKYHMEHLCPSYEQGKSKRASHPPKPVPNSRQRLHLLHMDLCGPMRIASINGKRYVLVIVDDYSRYTWVHLLRSKDEAPVLIITFLKRITVLLQKPDISFLHVFGALCYPKNDREDIGKLGAKGDIGFFIGYSADSCAYKIYNRRTKKIMETMNVSFDELLAMAFKQRSSKPGLQIQHSRTKHIAVRYHFIKEHVVKGTIELYFIKMDYQLVDIFTKALPADRFNYLVHRLGMRTLSPKELEHLAKSHQMDLPRNTPLDRVEVLVTNGNPSRVNIKQLCDSPWCYNLISAELKFKTPMLDHQDKHMMKAQVHVSKSSTISDVQALPRWKHYCQNDKSIKCSPEPANESNNSFRTIKVERLTASAIVAVCVSRAAAILLATSFLMEA